MYNNNTNTTYVDGHQGSQSHCDPIAETEPVGSGPGVGDGESGGVHLLGEQREDVGDVLVQGCQVGEDKLVVVVVLVGEN